MSLLQLKINNQDLTAGADKTYLAADSAVGDSTISVQSINKFAMKLFLLVLD